MESEKKVHLLSCSKPCPKGRDVHLFVWLLLAFWVLYSFLFVPCHSLIVMLPTWDIGAGMKTHTPNWRPVQKQCLPLRATICWPLLDYWNKRYELLPPPLLSTWSQTSLINI